MLAIGGWELGQGLQLNLQPLDGLGALLGGVAPGEAQQPGLPVQLHTGTAHLGVLLAWGRLVEVPQNLCVAEWREFWNWELVGGGRPRILQLNLTPGGL